MKQDYCPLHHTRLDPNGHVCPDCIIERLYGITLRAIARLREGF